MKKPSFDLSGKVAIVVGGTQGIGRAIALGLAMFGADVIPVSRSFEKSKKITEEIANLGRRGLALSVDVTKQENLEYLRDKALEEFGKIDILVNAAGMNYKNYVVDYTEEMFNEVIRTNLIGVFLACKVIGEQMVKQRKGKIINIASMGSFFGISRSSAYCASKGGVAQLTKVLAIEWAPYNVNVNAIAPGWFKTELTKPVYENPELSKKVIDRTPMGRWGEVEDLIGAAVFLASEASDFVTGTILCVDGGFSAFAV